jgi:hypothetical protein
MKGLNGGGRKLTTEVIRYPDGAPDEVLWASSGTRLPPDLFQPQVPDAPQGIPFPAGLADPVWPLSSGE